MLLFTFLIALDLNLTYCIYQKVMLQMILDGFHCCAASNCFNVKALNFNVNNKVLREKLMLVLSYLTYYQHSFNMYYHHSTLQVQVSFLISCHFIFISHTPLSLSLPLKQNILYRGVITMQQNIGCKSACFFKRVSILLTDFLSTQIRSESEVLKAINETVIQAVLG